jgi:hypothetical protein
LTVREQRETKRQRDSDRDRQTDRQRSRATETARLGGTPSRDVAAAVALSSLLLSVFCMDTSASSVLNSLLSSKLQRFFPQPYLRTPANCSPSGPALRIEEWDIVSRRQQTSAKLLQQPRIRGKVHSTVLVLLQKGGGWKMRTSVEKQTKTEHRLHTCTV